MTTRRVALFGVVGMLAGCAAPRVNQRRLPDFREGSYQTIGPGPGLSPDLTGRRPLPAEVATDAWEIMKGQLVSRRWEFVDVFGPQLQVHWGLGPAPNERDRNIDEDTLVLDIFDRNNGRRVWYAYAKDVDLDDREQLVEAVSLMLLRFPEPASRGRR